MSSPSKSTAEPTSSGAGAGKSGGRKVGGGASSAPRPPAKRRLSSSAVIEISDTESDDSDVCAVNSYQASADEVKRIRGDYSSTSSSSDYSSDSESPWEDDSVVLEDKVQIKVVKAQLNPRANRMDDPQFNPRLKSQELIDRLSTHWNDSKDHKSEEVTLTSEPFRLCLLHNILGNPEIINNIVDDMNTLDWSRKKTDLYEFHQTTDLANLTWQRSIRGIYELLKTEVLSWVSKVTGLELEGVSASCSLYGPGDHLLLHDDLLGDRRVAFILYLAPWTPRTPALHNGAGHAANEKECTDGAEGAVEGGEGSEGGEAVSSGSGGGSGWSAAMGGALELFARDAEGRPADVVRRVLPANNTLAFFKVGFESFHQVSEVVSLELPRLSINGWFHGPSPPVRAGSPPPPALDPPTPCKPHNDVVVLSQWLESAYLSARVRAQVQAQMERASEACLHDLLLPPRARSLLQALQEPEVQWERCGPSQQRRYERVSEAWLAAGGEKAAAEGTAETSESISEGECSQSSQDSKGSSPEPEHEVRALLRLASSATFMRMLAECTDLKLTNYVRVELQRWRPGDFTLLPPRSHYSSPRLEAVLYLGVPARRLRGGSTLYVAPEEAEAEALVTVPPQHNALSLVYCDAGAASFTKYLSRMTMPPTDHFYILVGTYTE